MNEITVIGSSAQRKRGETEVRKVNKLQKPRGHEIETNSLKGVRLFFFSH